MDDHHRADLARRRALLRFAVIGDLLAAPPPKGRLAATLDTLARKIWTGVDGDRRHKAPYWNFRRVARPG